MKSQFLKWQFFILLQSILHFGIGQDCVKINQTIFNDTFQSAQYLAHIEASLFDYYRATWGDKRAYQLLDNIDNNTIEIITFSDSIYLNRLQYISDISPFPSKPNKVLLKTVKYFVSKRNRFTSVVIGRSKLYFPLFETYLTKHNLPLELKYLPIIESALRPTGKSWAGAVGLWQIMYRTGRSLDLYSDSYVDDRLHPEKSTDAACRYLKYLYNLYGNWDIALAAYNAGPGNVNKAIRRSGGHIDYWAIRPFLPKETQQYVPNFYAMMYMMTFYKSHDILPMHAKVNFFETDSICLKSSVRISHLDSIIGLNSNDFKSLNPQYKTDIIPATISPQCIILPLKFIDSFLQFEDSIYNHQSSLDSLDQNYVILNKKTFHRVDTGETLASIAQLHSVTTSQLREWNGMRNSSILPNQRIVILTPEKRNLPNFKGDIVKYNTQSKSKSFTYSGNYKYYTLKSGESLWTVSKKLGIAFVDLQSLNKDLNPKKMRPGQKIRIKKI